MVGARSWFFRNLWAGAVVVVCVLVSTASALAQSTRDICGGYDAAGACINVEREMQMLKTYFRSQGGPTLLSAQSLLVTYGAYQGSPDGKWSKTTKSAFRGPLEMYIAIGGRGSNWGIKKPADTKRFLEWVAAAAYSNKNGTDFSRLIEA